MDAETYIDLSHRMCESYQFLKGGCTKCPAYNKNTYACKIHFNSELDPKEKIKIIEEWRKKNGQGNI